MSCNNEPKKKIDLPQFTKVEKKELKTFFEYLLLREGGIYVLFGSKPIVHSGLCIISEENLKKNYKKIPSNLKAKNKTRKIKLNFKIDGWEKVQDRIKMRNYLLVFKKHEEVGMADVYFVNIANTIITLQKHYDTFKNKVGFDFDPLEAIFELKNDNSTFWTTVEKDLVLQGLIFGYGKTNAQFFEYWIKNDKTKKEIIENLGFASSNDHLVDANIKVDYQNFPLPVFRNLPNDPTVKKYKNEREEIKKIFKHRNSLEITLEKLLGN